MNEYKNELDYYRGLNRVAERGGVVFFGSTFARNIPVAELGQSLGLDCTICNRSFTDLSVFDAAEVIGDAVLALEPKKIIMQLGETDTERGFRSAEQIAAEYESLVNSVKKHDRKIKIVIASVCSSDPECQRLNRLLGELAERCGVQYADICQAEKNEMPAVKAFSMLKFFIRDRLSFYDIMNHVNA